VAEGEERLERLAQVTGVDLVVGPERTDRLVRKRAEVRHRDGKEQAFTRRSPRSAGGASTAPPRARTPRYGLVTTASPGSVPGEAAVRHLVVPRRPPCTGS